MTNRISESELWTKKNIVSLIFIVAGLTLLVYSLKGVRRDVGDIFHRKAVAALNSKKYRDSIKYYGYAIAIYPRGEAYYYNRGLAYLFSGEWRRAEKDFSKYIDFAPEDASGYVARAQVRLLSGMRAEAEGDIHKAKQLDPSRYAKAAPEPGPLSKPDEAKIPEYGWGHRAVLMGHAYGVHLSSSTLWLPNTAPLDRGYAGAYPAFEHGGYWYFPVRGALVRYASQDKTFSLFKVPNERRQRAYSLGNLAVAEGKLLVSVQGLPLSIFDFEKERFVSNSLFGRLNLTKLVTDPYTGDIWAPTLDRMERWRADLKLWTNETGVFKANGMHLNGALIMPDEDYVWFAFSGWRGSGLMSYDKRNGKWSAYHRETLGRIGNNDREYQFGLLAVSGKYVLAAKSWPGGDLFAMDKASGKWTVYQGSSLSEGIALLMRELPELRWDGGSNDPLLFLHYSYKEHKLLLEHLKRTMEKNGLRKLLAFGTPEAYYAEGRIMARKNPAGAYSRQIEMPSLANVAYEQIIGPAGDDGVLLKTSSGVAYLDCAARKLAYFQPHVEFLEGDRFLPSKDKGKALICRQKWIASEEDAYSEPDSWKISELDLRKHTSVMRDGGHGACSGTAGVADKPVLLPSGRTVLLEWDGVLIR